MLVSGAVDVTGLVLNLNLLTGAPAVNIPYTLIQHSGNTPITGNAT